jgi:hypothetical protein
LKAAICFKRALLGREIFLQFDKVVILDKQIRVTDETWAGILRRLRVGECSARDLEEIQKLVLTNPECDVPDFSKAPWDQVILVTPRHSVKTFGTNMLFPNTARKPETNAT